MPDLVGNELGPVIDTAASPSPEHGRVAGSSAGSTAVSAATWDAGTAAGIASLLLAGCSVDETEALPQAFQTADKAPTRHLLGAAGPAESKAAAAAAAPLPTPDELMDWAEQHYPLFFPVHQKTLALAPYLYRYYRGTDTYLGLSGQDVYVLGPLSSGSLLRVGSLADFAPLVYATRHAYSDSEAARFLQQAQFSSTDAEIADVRSAGYAAWLERQFNTAPVAPSAWDWVIEKGYSAVGTTFSFESQIYPGEFATWYKLLGAPDAMRQRCALALSELFVVAVQQLDGFVWKGFLVAAYWDCLTHGAFGNFRDLLEDITLNPAMGYFLNTIGNQKEDPLTGREPDENYAREVMQLFTIGLDKLNADGTRQRDAFGNAIPAFAQSDVTQLAKVFTGYGVDLRDGEVRVASGDTIHHRNYARRRLQADPALHSPSAKVFLGTTIAAGTAPDAALKSALDTLFRHPNVGPFIGRQMIQRLVTSDPSPGYVARVAAAFADNGQGVRGDMQALWRAVLLDEDARSAQGLTNARWGKLREPMVRVMQWARSFGAKSRFGYWKVAVSPYDSVQQLSQVPLHAPSVFNFFRPGYVPPGTALATAGATAPEFQAVNESTVCSYINFLCGMLWSGFMSASPDVPQTGDLVLATAQAGTDVGTDYAVEVAMVPDFPALVSRINRVMCANQLSDSTVAVIISAMQRMWPHQRDKADGRRWMVFYALLYTMSSPEYLVQK